jgi:copper chaperone
MVSQRKERDRMSRYTYKVDGMTCSHCAAAVTEEVSRIARAQNVEVDLESGTLQFDGTGIDTAAVRAAVEEAGYSLA